MVTINPKAELSTIAFTRDSTPYGGSDALAAARALVNRTEITTPATGKSAKYESLPYPANVLDAEPDANRRKTFMRENSAWVRLVKYERLCTYFNARPGDPVDLESKYFRPADTISAWNAIAPINHSKNSGPRQAIFDWIVKVGVPADVNIRDSINAILLYEAMQSEVPAELAGYGLPLEAIAQIKAGLEAVRLRRREIQRIASSAEYQEASSAQRQALVEPSIRALNSLPAIIKILSASTELLSEEQRRLSDARSRAVSMYPGSIKDSAGRALTVKDISVELKGQIETARTTAVNLWISAYNTGGTVEISVPTLAP